MALEEIRWGEYVDTEEVENPECVSPEQFEAATFRNYLMPRLESARDEASAQVLAGLREGRGLGDSVLDTIESLPASKTRKLREWVEEAKGTHIYGYVKFHGMSSLSYGLMRTTGKHSDKVIDREKVGEWETSEGIAPYWEFRIALEEMDKTLQRESQRSDRERIGFLFGEVSLVEVDSKGDYEDALSVMGVSLDDSAWEKPGLYDFSESPPSYVGTIKDYERDSMKEEAGRAIEELFESPDLEETCRLLIAK